MSYARDDGAGRPRSARASASSFARRQRQARLPSVRKLAALTGFRARWSLREGLAETMRFYVPEFDLVASAPLDAPPVSPTFSASTPFLASSMARVACRCRSIAATLLIEENSRGSIAEEASIDTFRATESLIRYG